MKRAFRNFSRAHLWVFLGFYAAFTALTFCALRLQSPSDWQNNGNVAATAGVILGPFTGAIARHFQSCCWNCSLSLLPYCAVFLLGGTVFQLIPIPFRQLEKPIRLLIWSLGLLGWFGGGIISFGHALS